MGKINFKYPDFDEIKHLCSLDEADEHMPKGTKFYHVTSYEKLVELVAHLRFCNKKKHMLLFRGQNQLYCNTRGIYSFYPSLFRGKKNGLQFERDEFSGKLVKLKFAYQELKEKEDIKKYIKKYIKEYIKIWNTENDSMKTEKLLYSIIQHYELADTPVLDLTQSLQVAYHFGNKDNNSGFCYIIILGYPYLQGTQMLYKAKPNVINIPLLYNCPPNLLRPHFQEAYSVCDTKSTLDNLTNDNKNIHDQNKNLVAIVKIKINETDKEKYNFTKQYLQLEWKPPFIKEIDDLIQQKKDVLE